MMCSFWIPNRHKYNKNRRGVLSHLFIKILERGGGVFFTLIAPFSLFGGISSSVKRKMKQKQRLVQLV